MMSYIGERYDVLHRREVRCLIWERYDVLHRREV